MRNAKLVSVLVVMGGLCVMKAVQQNDEGNKKLGAYLGKWQIESTLSSGEKGTTKSECRWSPQGWFLVCEQFAKSATQENHQLVVYSYDNKSGKYSYTAVPHPGAKPNSGSLDINGNVWTADSSIEGGGKTIQLRSTREFVDDKTATMKSMRSDDGGQHWITLSEGKAQKTGD